MSSWTEEERAAYRERQLLQTPIADMNLPVRVINTLEDNNIILCEHLMSQSYIDLMKMTNFGEKTLTEVRAAIRQLGLTPPRWRRPPKPPPRPKGGNGNVIKFW